MGAGLSVRGHDHAQRSGERRYRPRGAYKGAWLDPDQGSFESWLWRIVLNVARDAGRSAGRRQALLERIQNFGRDLSVGDAEELALQHLSDEQVLVAVRRLPKRPRTVIAMRFGAHLTYREIGEQLGVSEAAALMTTRRALGALRRDIELKEALT